MFDELFFVGFHSGIKQRDRDGAETLQVIQEKNTMREKKHSKEREWECAGRAEFSFSHYNHYEIIKVNIILLRLFNFLHCVRQ